jgi:hypothetical protein
VSVGLKPPNPDHRRARLATWLPWGLWLLVVLVDMLAFGFLLSNDALSTRQRLGHLVTVAPFLVFATVGAVIIARRPSNRIGWLCWAISLTFSLSFFGGKDAWAVLATQDWSSAWALVPQLGTVAWLGALLGLLPFLILLFPTGRLPSHRWRPVAWTTGIVVVLYLTARLLTPGPVSRGLPANPLGVEPAEASVQLVQAIAGVAAPVLALAALASLVVRFRRARGDERQQLKWFTFVIAADLALIPTLGPVVERAAPLLGELVLFPVLVSMIRSRSAWPS